MFGLTFHGKNCVWLSITPSDSNPPIFIMRAGFSLECHCSTRLDKHQREVIVHQSQHARVRCCRLIHHKSQEELLVGDLVQIQSGTLHVRFDGPWQRELCVWVLKQKALPTRHGRKTRSQIQTTTCLSLRQGRPTTQGGKP